MNNGLSSFTDDRLATFSKESSPDKVDQFIQRFNLNGNPRICRPDIEIDTDEDGSTVIIWWQGDDEHPATTLNEKVRLYCREYAKRHPTNRMARSLYHRLGQPDCPPVDHMWETLDEAIYFIRAMENRP